MRCLWVALVSVLAVRAVQADITVTVTLSNEGQMLAQATGISTTELASSPTLIRAEVGTVFPDPHDLTRTLHAGDNAKCPSCGDRSVAEYESATSEQINSLGFTPDQYGYFERDRGADGAAIFSAGAQDPGRGQVSPLERLAARPSPLSPARLAPAIALFKERGDVSAETWTSAAQQDHATIARATRMPSSAALTMPPA